MGDPLSLVDDHTVWAALRDGSWWVVFSYPPNAVHRRVDRASRGTAFQDSRFTVRAQGLGSFRPAALWPSRRRANATPTRLVLQPSLGPAPVAYPAGDVTAMIPPSENHMHGRRPRVNLNIKSGNQFSFFPAASRRARVCDHAQISADGEESCGDEGDGLEIVGGTICVSLLDMR